MTMMMMMTVMVVMIVVTSKSLFKGLPGAGKTHWAEKYCAANPGDENENDDDRDNDHDDDHDHDHGAADLTLFPT